MFVLFRFEDFIYLRESEQKSTGAWAEGEAELDSPAEQGAQCGAQS